MEQHTDKQDRKKAQLRLSVGGGGGIGGAIVLGGALAVAGLFAAFRVFKSRKRNASKNPPPPTATNSCGKNQDDGTQGHPFILQTPSSIVPHGPHDQCCRSHRTSKIVVAQIDSRDLVSTQDLILEEKAPPIINGRDEICTSVQEIFVSNGSEEESSVSCVDFGIIEEVFDCEPKNMIIKDDSEEDSESMETIGEQKEDEAADADREENSPMQSDEEEDDDDDDDDSNKENVFKKMAIEENSPVQSAEEEVDDDEIIEKGEESLEGTESSSMESLEEAIWQAIMIEALSIEFKEKSIIHQNLGAKIEEEDRTSKTEKHGYLDNINNNGNYSENSMIELNMKETQELAPAPKQAQRWSKQRSWIWPMLVLVLLLIMHHKAFVFLFS